MIRIESARLAVSTRDGDQKRRFKVLLAKSAYTEASVVPNRHTVLDTANNHFSNPFLAWFSLINAVEPCTRRPSSSPSDHQRTAYSQIL